MSPGQLLASFKKKELRLLGLREKNKTISAGFNCSRQQKCCLYMKGSGILHMNSVTIIYECEAADRILYLFSPSLGFCKWTKWELEMVEGT